MARALLTETVLLLDKPLHSKTSSLTKPLAQHCSVPLCMRRQSVTILKCTSLCRVWAKMSPPPTGDDDDNNDHFSSHFLLVKTLSEYLVDGINSYWRVEPS
jgi:hypothetical protein